MIHITDGTVLSEGKEFRWDILIKDGKIAYAGPDAAEVLSRMDAADVSVIDASGKYVSPGFIDIHTHGGAGADFMDGSMEAYRTALRLHTSHGTTLIYPTTLTGAKDSLLDSVRSYQKIKAAGIEGAEMGGLHFEGPYFAYSKKGAQDPRYLRNPDPEEYMELLEEAHGDIARWSLAPELPGALEMAEKIGAKGVLVAMGHTDATFDECDVAFNAGFTHMTHFFSCMSSIMKNGVERNAGVIEYGYYNDDVTVEIIGDGVHVPAALLKLVFKIKGAENVALVTDSVRPAGFEEGHYIMGGDVDGLEVIVEDGVAKLADRSALAGSVSTMDYIVRTVRDLTGLPLAKVVQSATQTPARIMGVDDRKGMIKKGYDADVLIFDENIELSHVFVKGKLYQ